MAAAALSLGLGGGTARDGAVEVLVRPERPLVHRGPSGEDIAFSLQLHNPSDLHYRIVRWRARWAPAGAGAEVVSLERASALQNAPRYLEGQRLVVWQGLCLTVPEGATELTLEVELAHRRRAQSLQVATTVFPERRELDVALRLPFSGVWKVTQGHDCGSAHRTAGFGGEFAWDFAALAADAQQAAVASFGAPVLAPAAGRVVMAENDMPDHDARVPRPLPPLLETLVTPQHMFGNFVVLDVGGGSYVLLGHLMEGSVQVEPGQQVEEGDTLARCGNSGYTVQPHVHVQVMDRKDPADPKVRGVPAVFRDYTEILLLERTADRSDLWLHQVSRGDPQPGALVSPR